MLYSELHCFTNFSFLKGASHPEEMVQQAAALGYQALAITDECSVAGVVRAHVEARRHNIKLIIENNLRSWVVAVVYLAHSFLQDVGIYLGSGNIRVTEHLLNGS